MLSSSLWSVGLRIRCRLGQRVGPKIGQRIGQRIREKIGEGVAIATCFLPIVLAPLTTASLSTFSPPRPLASAILPPAPPVPFHVGTLRVQNQTYHPIRIALLPQLSETAPIVRISTDTTEQMSATDASPLITDDFRPSRPGESAYGEAIHWDFVPREGHEDGLVLALPEGQFWVKPGDIVTAFAQDGSRRYWGPYVIGATESPIWDEETREWRLILETPFPF
ncbi:MAG: hypothetical protein AB4042_04390 [Leptolyngbyaceae cyanobacterium]